MEFEGDKPISEDEVRLAQSRQVTLQPLHSDVTPDALPDEAVASAHLSSDAIGNVAGDIEQDAPLVRPPVGATILASPDMSHKSRTMVLILTITGLVLFVLVILFIIFQR